MKNKKVSLCSCLWLAVMIASLFFSVHGKTVPVPKNVPELMKSFDGRRIETVSEGCLPK